MKKIIVLSLLLSCMMNSVTQAIEQSTIVYSGIATGLVVIGTKLLWDCHAEFQKKEDARKSEIVQVAKTRASEDFHHQDSSWDLDEILKSDEDLKLYDEAYAQEKARIERCIPLDRNRGEKKAHQIFEKYPHPYNFCENAEDLNFCERVCQGMLQTLQKAAAQEIEKMQMKVIEEAVKESQQITRDHELKMQQIAEVLVQQKAENSLDQRIDAAADENGSW